MTRTTATTSPPPRPPRSLLARVGLARPGFTLIEMMVGVGAVAIVSVGLAVIFNSVGKTVTGGRRISTVNTTAALIENTLRRDFANMDRDGFLIIRNQYVDLPAPNANPGSADGDGAYVWAQDRLPIVRDQPLASARGHRIDEIQFVTAGPASSGRQPTFPGNQASSNTQVVYYGHGQMAATVTAASPTPSPLPTGYRKPAPQLGDPGGDVVDPAENRLGHAGVNRYPSNWMLLRHQTLLASGEASASTNDPLLADKLTQVAEQPASSSLFRSIASILTDGGPPNQTTQRRQFDNDPSAPYPHRGSGIVDICTESLSDVRAVVGSLSALPAAVSLPLKFERTMTPAPAGASAGSRPGSYETIDRMQAWLSDTMPTESRNRQINDFNSGPFDSTRYGVRMRYEPAPPDLLASYNYNNSSDEQLKAARRADQLMLSASNFIPHCTDFIVDWSFGQVGTNGKLIWFGLPAPVVPPATPPVDAPVPYPNLYSGATAPYQIILADGSPPHTVTDRLIYGFSPSAAGDDAAVTAYFGWTDPTYVAAATPPSLPPDLHSTTVVPWAWPRMVRITVTIADPQDGSENSLQYVFELPQHPLIKTP